MTFYKPVWKERFQVRSADIGYQGIMRISNLCSYFQEVAGKHASHLGVGYMQMKALGMAWVLSKLAVKIQALPAWNEEFDLETWPLGQERFLFRRDFKLSQDQETMIRASSYWIPYDPLNKRPGVVHFDPSVVESNKGNFALEETFPSLPQVNHQDGDAETVIARYSDLDQNRHVNNARYVEWIFDFLGLEVLTQGTPAFFAIAYKQEVRPGDRVTLIKSPWDHTDNSLMVQGNLEGTGQVCFRCKILFQS